ncbi:MAG: Rrf2 family transcriptional regulator [Deltaproteobacteria bacterium]|nr:Rrf2 family transcriptional regulator [Deltaproteobacteria bacterium]
MRITAQEEYGLRCMLQIARHEGVTPMAISEIAKAEGLSTQYVAKLLNRLHRARLIESVRGIHGGFRLTRPADAVAVGAVLEALGGTLQSRHNKKPICETFVGNRDQCVHVGNCSIRPLWFIIMEHVAAVLNRLTLKNLIDEESHAQATITQQFRETSPHTQPVGMALPTYAGGMAR